MENLSSWWYSLDTLSQVYWAVAIISSLTFLVVFVMSMMGADADSDADMDGDADADADGDLGGGSLPHLLSFKTIAAFFMGASWTGITAINGGSPVVVVVLLSLLAGALVMGATAFLLKSLMKLQQNSILTMDKTIGLDGEVYYSIQPDMKAGGQVELLVNGSYKTFEAVTNDPLPIKPKERIVVLDVLEGNVLLVGRMEMSLNGSESKPIE
ncbi:MAG: hypothetical protein MJZ66_06380 [Bacteroidales bacterium]|nr:hypothetical protein [Bacteroidales bacterium]